jgi:hypothetical protein
MMKHALVAGAAALLAVVGTAHATAKPVHHIDYEVQSDASSVNVAWRQDNSMHRKTIDMSKQPLATGRKYGKNLRSAHIRFTTPIDMDKSLYVSVDSNGHNVCLPRQDGELYSMPMFASRGRTVCDRAADLRAQGY